MKTRGMVVAGAALALVSLACGSEKEDPPTITAVTANATTVDEGGTVTVTVTATGNDLTYEWTGGGTFQDTAAASTAWTAPIVSTTSHTPASQTETLTVNVTNSAGMVTDTVDVDITNLNEVPVIDTAPSVDNATPKPGTDVGLSVTASDPESDTLTYSWAQTAPATPMGTFTNEDTATPTWRAPAVGTATTFTFEVTITDPDTDEVIDTTTTSVQVATWAADVLPVLDMNGVDCSSCHAGGSGGLTYDLNGDPAGAITTWINTQMARTCGGNTYNYIVPGDPSSSGLFYKISGTTCQGNQMPNNDQTYFTNPAGNGPQELFLIESWILAGANNN